MRVGRVLLDFMDWLPILAAPVVVYLLTEGFTKSLSPEVWLILAFAVVANFAWIGFARWNRQMVNFRKKYSGFRMKR